MSVNESSDTMSVGNESVTSSRSNMNNCWVSNKSDISICGSTSSDTVLANEKSNANANGEKKNKTNNKDSVNSNTDSIMETDNNFSPNDVICDASNLIGSIDKKFKGSNNSAVSSLDSIIKMSNISTDKQFDENTTHDPSTNKKTFSLNCPNKTTICTFIENTSDTLTLKADEIIIKFQIPSFKIVVKYIISSLLVTSALNTFFAASVTSSWNFIGGPNVIIGLITVSLSSALLVWYATKPEILKNNENLPYVLSLAALSKTLGNVDYLVSIFLAFGWINMGFKQLSLLFNNFESLSKGQGFLLLLAVSNVIIVILSIIILSVIKILEANILYNNIKNKNFISSTEVP